jgi:hypothetical protein
MACPGSGLPSGVGRPDPPSRVVLNSTVCLGAYPSTSRVCLSCFAPAPDCNRSSRGSDPALCPPGPWQDLEQARSVEEVRAAHARFLEAAAVQCGLRDGQGVPRAWKHIMLAVRRALDASLQFCSGLAGSMELLKVAPP